MEEVIAGLERFTFTLEKDVEMQKGIEPLPFQGMDKSSSAVCNFYAKGLCEKGRLCPFRHDHGEKTVVCKHWLRGLCKKGDQCRFLHQYDLSRMPECYFFSKFGECSNKECYFLHMKTASEAQACPSYDQGFCKEGPLCKYRHVKRVMCTNYLVGFCPLGPECQYAHPKMVPLFNPTPRAVRMANKGISKPGFCLNAWPEPHPRVKKWATLPSNAQTEQVRALRTQALGCLGSVGPASEDPMPILWASVPNVPRARCGLNGVAQRGLLRSVYFRPSCQ